MFKSLLGETLNQFVKRLRLERALYLISHAPNRSLTDVALDCGFSRIRDAIRWWDDDGVLRSCALDAVDSGQDQKPANCGRYRKRLT